MHQLCHFLQADVNYGRLVAAQLGVTIWIHPCFGGARCQCLRQPYFKGTI